MSAADLAAKTLRDDRQWRAYQWAHAAFGPEQMVSTGQRAIRFLEEAVELYQAVIHLQDAVSDDEAKAMAHAMVDYVFNREPGDAKSEFGGVGLTLLCLAQCMSYSADGAEADELARVLSKPLAHFKARNQVKNDAGFNVSDRP
jgi:NTP pyrophosphatase (non-canonical NTP hydrolase)